YTAACSWSAAHTPRPRLATRGPTPTRPLHATASCLLRHGHDSRRRAMIRYVGAAAAGAPVVIVRLEGNIDRRIALVPVAQAAATRALPTTVVIRHDVVAPVGRIV